MSFFTKSSFTKAHFEFFGEQTMTPGISATLSIATGLRVHLPIFKNSVQVNISWVKNYILLGCITDEHSANSTLFIQTVLHPRRNFSYRFLINNYYRF